MKKTFSILVCFVILFGFATAEQQTKQFRSFFECDRSAPLLCGETVTFTWNDRAESFNVWLTLNDVLTDEEFRRIALDASKHNKALLELADTKMFVAAELTVKMECENINEKFMMSSSDFDVVSANGTVYPFASSSHYFMDLVNDVKMFSGGEATFYVLKSVDKEDKNPCLLYNDTIWISLAEE